MKRTARKSMQSTKPLEEDVSKLSILEETNPPEKSTVPVKAVEKVVVKQEKGLVEAEEMGAVGGVSAQKNSSILSKPGPMPLEETNPPEKSTVPVKAVEKVVVKQEKGLVEAEEMGAVGGVSAQKNSSILSKPGPMPYFQKRKIVSVPVLDDCNSEIDYTPVVVKVEPAGILYDDKGIHIASGLDLCDCGTKNCSGCWYPCPKCGSIKCGLHCRVHRKFMYEEVIVEGHGYVYRNELYKDLRK